MMGIGRAGGNRGAFEELQGVQARAAGGDPYAMLELADRLVHGDMLPQNHAQVISFTAMHGLQWLVLMRDCAGSSKRVSAIVLNSPIPNNTIMP